MFLLSRKTVRSALALVALSLVLSILAPDRPRAELARVGWTNIVSTKSGQCLSSPAGSQAGSSVQQAPCQPQVGGQWSLQPIAQGFMIINAQGWQCLTAAGNLVVQGACAGGASTTWTATPSGNGFRLSTASNGLCLTPAGDSNSAGATMTMGSCTDPNLSTWVIQSGLILPAQLITLQANHSGQCMVTAAAGTPHAGALVQNPCAGTSPEQWRVVPTANTYQYTIAYGNTGQCLTAANATAGGAIAPVACTGAASQQFSMWAVTPGYLVNLAGTSLCLDVAGGSAAAGAQVVLAACAYLPHEEWSVAMAHVPASWTQVVGLNNDPMAVANLPDGTLLTWSSKDPFGFEGDISYATAGTTYSIFTPSTLGSSVDRYDTAGADMFCPGTANLADGRVLVNGGSSSPKTTIYDPSTGLFTADAFMNIPRGYEADTSLSNGSVLTLGGSWSGAVGGKNGEIWTKGQGWKVLSSVPETPSVGPDPGGLFRGDNHMWLFSFSNGIVLQAGPSAQMNWIFTAGQGAVYPAGARGDDAYSINGNAVMYDVGKILKAGGAPAYDNYAVATGAAYTITVNNAGLAVGKVAPMAYPRAFANGVALPSGQVMITGGQTLSEPFTDTNAVLVPELWDPKTGVFQQLAPMQSPRTYHSTGILLNDGRVFVGGGWQCGATCTTNHFTTEILSPPYLLNSDGSAATRPVITGAPTTAPPGSTITVTTDSPVTSFALMRNASNTHSVNNDQRRIPLAIQSSAPSGSGNSYTLTIPADTGVTLPGYYMLFALNPLDVPSVAASVLIH